MAGMASVGPHLQGLPIGTMMNVGSSSDKLAVPVRNYSVFSQFKHVEGVPAGNGPGYSVSKLQVLDILIDRLVKLNEKASVRQVPEDVAGLPEAAVDALIQDLAHKLKTAAATPVNPADVGLGTGFGMSVSQTGAVVSLLV